MKFTGLEIVRDLWEAVGMATKKARNKAVHKAVQSTRKENKSQAQQAKKSRREDFSQAAARIVRKATEGN